MAGREWTVEDRHLAVKLRRAGSSFDAIAAQLGRTRRAVEHVVNAAHVHVDHRTWTGDELQRAARLRVDGATYAAIGEQLRRTKASTSNQLHSLAHEAMPTDPKRRTAWLILAIADGRYRGRSEHEWVRRLAEPEVLGAVLRDIIAAAKRTDPDVPSVVGRRRGDYVRPGDVAKYLPPVLRKALPHGLWSDE